MAERRSDIEPTVIEVFADIVCPFTHVGLRRFVERRRRDGRDDVMLCVRSWPLELVNGVALAADFVADEIVELRAVAAPDLFRGFSADTFPATSMPALSLVASAYEVSVTVGESVSLAVRDRLFEDGLDVEDPASLRELADRFGVPHSDPDATRARVIADLDEGRARGVIGSPHFFTPRGDFFCPALDVSRDAEGHLHVAADPAAFDAFVDTCFETD